jgi:copper oxidase (laccase) domain-containing protein
MYKFQTTNTELGISYKSKNINIFFGNKNLTLDKLNAHNIDVEKKFINQKHSTIIGVYPSNEEISDGYQWNQNKYAAIIRTADCLPLICVDHLNHRITNIHCGRVGLTDGILNEFLKIADTNSEFSFFIGPHIETYEIGKDLYLDLESKGIGPLNSINNKYFFSLAGFVSEFIKNNFKNFQIYQCNINTFTDNSYWSYRKDKGTISRNLSYAFFGEE